MTKAIPKSTDFHVGQPVFCKDPKAYVGNIGRYLEGKTGVVEEVYPATRPDPNYCGQINRVAVRWLKKGNRGKERRILMSPHDILPVADEQPAQE